ncbi:hypothetical protein HK096_001801 [Nowakowskiella sp. JEL0078]|nr:hypothetical protein HK096_001801 [Nowakowskiella sp. JEL0078]
MVVIVVLGAIGGFLLHRFALIGCLSLGALLGFLGSNLVFISGIGGFLQQAAHITVVVVCILAACGFIFFYESLVIVLSTAVTGAYAIAIGLDIFAKTGFLEVTHLSFQAKTPRVEQIPGPSWAMMAGVIVLAVLGWAMQTRPSPSGSIPSAKPFVWFWPWGGIPVQSTTWLNQQIRASKGLEVTSV